MNLTVVIPYYNGDKYIDRLLNSIPENINIIVVDDKSDTKFATTDPRVRTIRNTKKGYFTGAVNSGIAACSTDVLVLNQDIWFEDWNWLQELEQLSEKYAYIGDGVFGHPAWPKGYIQGTFMYCRRDALDEVGPFNEIDYPLWGSTCEWQLRVCRKGYYALPIKDLAWFNHRSLKNQKFGDAITDQLKKEPGKRSLFIRTPPEISVIIPCHNYGRYLPDAINSLIGGRTSLGMMDGQTFQSFEIIIVNDASTDNSLDIIKKLADDWKGIKYINLKENVGCPQAINVGVKSAFGKFITVLSADDMRESDSLNLMYRTILKNEHSVVYDDLVMLTGNQRIKGFNLPEYDFDTLIYKNQMHAGILYSKKAWKEAGGYPIQMVDGREDWAFNVALGIHGYCGVRVKNNGYIYRREGQNRTERNKGVFWRQTFLEQIKKIFPQIYGGKKPMGCCGSRGSSAPSKSSGINIAALELGAEGMTKVEYIGGNYGTQDYLGPVTGVKYVFGLSKPTGWVDNRDLVTNNRSKPGILEFAEGGKMLFKVAPTVPVPAPAPAVVPEPEPEPVVELPVVAEMTAFDEGSMEISMASLDEIELKDPASMTVTELEDYLGSMAFTLEQLSTLYSMESSGKARVTALAILTTAIESFE